MNATMRLMLVGLCSAALAPGCGSKGDDLKPGDQVLVAYSEMTVNSEAFSKGQDGKVTVVLPGPSGFADLRDGSRAIVIEDSQPTSDDQNRAIRIRIDEGEHNGETCKIARVFLVKVSPRN